MDSEKLVRSDTSSEEYDHQNTRHEYSSETKRSYDCTFCKRGFTNAQALGGHMNIHRKDRAKAKQITANYDSYSFPGEFSNLESMASPFLSSEVSAGKYHSIFESPRNQNVYFQPSEANPRNHFQYEFLNPSSQPLTMNRELWNANLSVKAGTSHLEVNEFRRGFQNDGEVDLELRLGHDPY